MVEIEDKQSRKIRIIAFLKEGKKIQKKKKKPATLQNCNPSNWKGLSLYFEKPQLISGNINLEWSNINLEWSKLRHILVTLLNFKNKDKILSTSRQKEQIIYVGKQIQLATEFLKQTYK